MKRYLITLTLALLATIGVVGAQIHSAYFLNGSSQRYNLNPALSPDRGYFEVPLIGISTGMYSNFLSLDNFFFPTADGKLVTYMNSQVKAEDFLAKLPDNNRLSFSINDQIIGLGNYFRAGFWAIGVNLRSETDINLPKEFFGLAKTLSSGNHDISGLSIDNSEFLEASFGYTFPVQDVFTLGFKAKALLGLAHISAQLDQMNIYIGKDKYEAQLTGTIEANINGLDLSGMDSEFTVEEVGNHISQVASSAGLNNVHSFGMALDAGIEWLLMDDQLKLSAGVTDLGWITWNAANSYCGTIENIGFSYSGMDLENYEVKYEAPEEILIKTTNDKITNKKSLHTNYLVGLEYNYHNNLLGLGALWTGKQYNGYMIHQATAAVTYRPARWFAVTLSDTLTSGNANSVGLALNITSQFVNLFAGLDYLSLNYGTAEGGKIPIPLSQKSLNFQFGMSLPLGVRHF